MNPFIRPYYVLLLVMLLGFCMPPLQAQPNRFDTIEQALKRLAAGDAPGLNQEIKTSLSDVSLRDFIRGIANAHNLNLIVAPDLELSIVANFSDEKAYNVLLFLCKQYDLDIEFQGTIMSIYKFAPPPAEKILPKPKVPQVKYDAAGDRLTLDLRNDTLDAVVRKIIQLSKKNIIPARGLGQQLVNAYIETMPFRDALEKLAFANDLVLSSPEDDVYVLEKKEEVKPDKSGRKGNRRNNRSGSVTEGLQYSVVAGVNGEPLLTVEAVNVPIVDIIKGISKELKIDYLLFAEPEGNATLNFEKISYDDLLSFLLQNTKATYKLDNGIYLIGDRTQEGLRDTRVVQMQYRSVENITDFIPKEFQVGVEIKVFNELNSIILSGSSPQIREVIAFLKEIDQVVPVIMIEVIIVNVTNTKTLKTGISAGTGRGDTTAQTLLPGVDYKLSTRTLNNIVSVLSSNGIVNLGRVAPDFYVTLSALETAGNLKIRSTPKLSTLNGHEATMTIGETDYYAEDRRDIIGSQNPQTAFSRRFEPIQANRTITINPIVSGDEFVTLTISVDESTFKPAGEPNAPRGTENRKFESIIRVKNEEMIVLGGLETITTGKTTSGLPILSRIPLLRYFFSRKEDSKIKGRLNVFIKPTILF